MTDSPAQPDRFSRLRALLYVLAALAIGAVLIVAMTWFVIGSPPRSQAIASAEGIRVAEYIALPADDAYPAALAIAADGTLYTGSYQSGALWAVSPAGKIREIPGSRERIGSVTGLDVAADGALYILDRIAPLDAQGAIIWRYAAGELQSLAAIPNDAAAGVLLPDDIALDSAGRIYISDRAGRVLQFSAAGERLGIWWAADCRQSCAPTGLAWDHVNHALLVADSEFDAVFRIPSIGGIAGASSLIFAADADAGYGLDGMALAPTGEIYLALLAWNRVARLSDGELIMLAKDFRGASDLAYHAAADRLFVTNWNQFSLGFGTRPQLPFALDVIDLSP